jgi:hypothetical protein
MVKFITVLIFCTQALFAQVGNLVFNDTILHNIFIETDLPNWFDSLELDYKINASIAGHPQKYFKCDVTFDNITLTNCGFKEKGNASNSLINYGKKKPLKISFSTFQEQTLNGIKRINLNNFTNDPSALRDAVCMKLMRDEGLPASRTSYAKVFVNKEYIGLYVIIENVDKTFLKLHYGGKNNNGNLYKTDRSAQVLLNWLGEDKQRYKDKKFQLTTNDSIDDWSKFIGFVNFLNFNSDENFKEQLEKKFDIHTYLKILAIEKCVKSWDSYWGGGNNFFLYEHPDGMYRWIPWDMNETFQELNILSKTKLLEGYLIPTPQLDERPLIKQLFKFDDYKNEYLENACRIINSTFSENHLGKFIVKTHQLINAAYNEDPYKYNSYDDFKKSLMFKNEDVVPITKFGYALRLKYPGILPFITERRKWVLEQLAAWDKSCAIEKAQSYELKLFPNPATEKINIFSNNQSFDYSQYKIIDATGKIVLASDYQLNEKESSEINISSLAAGIYFVVKISSGGSFGKAKLLVDK